MAKRAFLGNVGRGLMEAVGRPGELVAGTVAGALADEKDWGRGLRAFTEGSLVDSQIREDFNKVMEEHGILKDSPKWRAAAGFAADVVSDPLNLFGGAGLLRRGLVKGAGAALGAKAGSAVETAIVKAPQALWKKGVVTPVKGVGNLGLSKLPGNVGASARRRRAVGKSGRSLETAQRLSESRRKGDIAISKQDLEVNLVDKFRPTEEQLRLVGLAIHAPLTTSGAKTQALTAVLADPKLSKMYDYARKTSAESAATDVLPIRKVFAETPGTAPAVIPGAGSILSPTQSLKSLGDGDWGAIQKNLDTLDEAEFPALQQALKDAVDEFGFVRNKAALVGLSPKAQALANQLIKYSSTKGEIINGERIGTVAADLATLKLSTAVSNAGARSVLADVSSAVPNYLRRTSTPSAFTRAQPSVSPSQRPIASTSRLRSEPTEKFLAEGGDTNVYTAMESRLRDTARATESRRLSAEVFQDFGEDVAKVQGKIDKNTWRTIDPQALRYFPDDLKLLAAGRALPNAAADLIEERLVRYADPAGMEEISHWALRLFKTFATALNLPSHQAINFTGNIANMYAHGMSPLDISAGYARAFKDLRTARKNLSQAKEKTGLISRTVKPGGKAKSYADLGFSDMEDAVRSGSIGELTGFGGEFTSGLRSTGVRKPNPKDLRWQENPWSPINPDARFYEAARSINQNFVEDPAKLAMFRWARKGGKSVDDASMDVKAALFDYSELTNFEKRFMRNVIPFYTWTRKNIPLQLANVLERPGRIANQGRLLSTINELVIAGESEDPLTHYATPKSFKGDNTINLPDIGQAIDDINFDKDFLSSDLFQKGLVPAKTQMGSPVATSVRLPFFDTDLLSAGSPKELIRDWAFMLNPAIRGPLEFLNNKRFGSPDLPSSEIRSDRAVNASTLGRLAQSVGLGKGLGVVDTPRGPKQRALSKWITEQIPIPVGAVTRGVGAQSDEGGNRESLGILPEMAFRATGLTPRALTYGTRKQGAAEWKRENDAGRREDREEDIWGFIKRMADARNAPPEAAPSSKFGLRLDGTPKGLGFFGELKRPDGSISTELSIGVSFDDGKEIQLPLIVPALTRSEIQSLLTGAKPSKSMVNRAVQFYKERIADGKPAFAQPGEQQSLSQHGRVAGKKVSDSRQREPQGRRGLVEPAVPAMTTHDVASPDLIRRVIQQESGGDPNAVSPVGAQGLMQIMPATALDPGFGVPDVFTLANQMGISIPTRGSDIQKAKVILRTHPDLNERLGTAYLNALVARYPGDLPRALAAYNWGAGHADAWDGTLRSLPAETQGYLKNILA